jgi:hypothetical protein
MVQMQTTAPKPEAAMVTITAEELAEFQDQKKLIEQQKVERTQARAYLLAHMDESD